MLLMFIAESSGMPLGFNPVSILIHLFNLAILLVGVRFLLYKPIKNFMDKRKAEYIEIDEKSQEKNRQADEVLDKYNKLMENAKQESNEILQKTTTVANEQADQIIKTAKKDATAIIEKAREASIQQQLRDKEELSESISSVAVDMASKILEREVGLKDNDAVIDNILNEWKKK